LSVCVRRFFEFCGSAWVSVGRFFKAFNGSLAGCVSVEFCFLKMVRCLATLPLSAAKRRKANALTAGGFLKSSAVDRRSGMATAIFPVGPLRGAICVS
jgi:hypothetical protein